MAGRKWLSKPERYIGCSALEEEGSSETSVSTDRTIRRHKLDDC